MVDRKTMLNALIELECEQTTYARELLRKNWAEALTTAEFDPCSRLNGRTANKELAMYDAEMAEIHANRKDAMRNRRRDRRNHPDNPETRKADKIRREKRMYGLVYIEKYGFCWIGGRDGKKKFPEYEAETVRNLRMKSAEAVERKDWLME